MEKTILLLSLFFCHLLADYTHLSTSWMLSAKRLGKPLFPIFCHAFIHASLMAMTLEIYFHYTIVDYKTVVFSFTLIDKLFLLQLLSHFFIDVWKGKMNYWFPSLQSPANKWHWVLHGFDQYAHSVVIILMVYFV